MFNAATAATAPTATSSAPAPVTAQNNGYRIGEPAQSLDSFEKTFGVPPYAEGKHRGGRWIGKPPGAISPKLVRDIAAKLGNVVPPNDKTELEKIHSEEKILHERMSSLGFWSVTTRWMQAKAEAEIKIKAGEKNIFIPDRATVLASICTERGICHELFRQCSARTYSILKAACEKFRKIAEEFVRAQDALEKAAHSELHDGAPVPFEPSGYLRALVWIALAVSEAPVRNFELCANLPSPDPSVPLVDLWVRCSPEFNPAVVLPKPVITTEAVAERRRQIEAEAASRHAKDLEAKNAMTAKIQADVERVAAEKELAGVKAEMEREARQAELKAKIISDAQANATKPTP